jgi:TPR repeat protein
MEMSNFLKLGAICVTVAALTCSGPSALVSAEEIPFESTKAAAEKGDPKAEFDLAKSYDRGTGVETDYAKAAEYASRSAEQGYASAKILLGSYYGRGLGVRKDPQEAVKWYRKAAEQGNPLAQYAMGGFYSSGRGVAKDTDEAIRWWRKAADQNSADAEAALGEFYFLPSNDRANHLNYQEAAKWLRKAADQGQVAAMNNLGLLYEQGLGLARPDPQGAAKWYRAAAEKGDAKGQANLGLLYLDGRGVPYDLSRGYMWLKLSAAQGYVVGTKYLEEYDLAHKLSPKELAEGERLFAEFRAGTKENKTAASAK